MIYLLTGVSHVTPTWETSSKFLCDKLIALLNGLAAATLVVALALAGTSPAATGD
ncbi:MAG: hypothetical protein AAB296_05870 [Candidatus Desantisbacteria bacterium]